MKVLCFFILCFFPSDFFGLQDHPIQGKVITLNNENIYFANIVLFKKSNDTFVAATVSDLEGNFVFGEIETTNEVYLQVRSLGYEIFNSQPFFLSEDLDDFLIRLEKVETPNISKQK